MLLEQNASVDCIFLSCAKSIYKCVPERKSMHYMNIMNTFSAILKRFKRVE